MFFSTRWLFSWLNSIFSFIILFIISGNQFVILIFVIIGIHWIMFIIVGCSLINGGAFGGNKNLISLCHLISSCDTSTEKETRPQLTPSLLLIEILIFFFSSLDLLFLLFLLYSFLFWMTRQYRRGWNMVQQSKLLLTWQLYTWVT